MNAPASNDEVACLKAALREAWARSDRLFAMLEGDAILDRPIGLRHPFLFYLGHLPAFLWNQVGGGVLELESGTPALDELFERGIDPLSEECAEAVSITSWPAVEEVLAYRDRIRRWTLDESFALVAARRGDVLADRYRVHHLALEHELMHHETLLYMFAEQGRKARGDLPRAVVGAAEGVARSVEVPAGTTCVGADFDAIPFGWDNEFPRCDVAVDAFTIDSLPVTVGAWAAFVADGGPVPHNWVERPGGHAVRAMFEELPVEAVSGWPVQVSHAQATAYAEWAGGRLPTEAELHRAAYGSPAEASREYPWGAAGTAGRGVFDFVSWSPQPVGRFPSGASAWGVEELVGNGWEWTSTVFAPLPGFEAWARTYPGYSADFFDEQHFVVFGGSWATDRRLLRRSFRNWYQGHYPYVFSSFRLVR